MGLKFAVIGGASSYTPELFANLIDLRERLEVAEVVLVDLNPGKLALIAEVSERLLKAAGLEIRIRTVQRREEAIAEADFVILQIRVGGLAARVRDETLPMEFDMVGNETTGAGGFVCALRTVPVAMEIAQEMEHHCPNVWLMNLSNPAGIVTEAILKHSRVRTMGFCNIPINTQYELSEILHVPPLKIRLDSFGLNHLSWIREVYVDDQEVLQPLISKAHTRHSALYQRGLVDSLIDPDWLQTLRMIPAWYNRYFYYTEEAIKEERRSLRRKGEQDMLAEDRLRQIYSTAGYNQEARQILESKGGARYYLPVLRVIDSIVHDRGEVVVVDVRNGSALLDLPQEVCVEVPARIGKKAVEPLPSGPMPLSVRGLVQAVKAYEELTIQAALSGDRRTAIEALVANPLVASYSKAKKFFDRVLESERAYLPQFLNDG